jgi:hypothetical protein
MFLALVILLPIACFLVWGAVHDLRRHRRREPLTNHDPRQVARETRIRAEGKGTEWSG